jgi:Ca2+-binding EF-hand superfamily protein
MQAAGHELFAAADKNADGRIDAMELHDMLAVLLGVPPTAGQVHQALADLDTDRDGVVSRDEFSAW